jgi:Tol biopolymer transport system component
VVFGRFLPGADHGQEFGIAAGGTAEYSIRAVYDAAILSHDGTRFADVAPTPDGGVATAVFNVDGSDYHFLPAPDDTLLLVGAAWSPDDTRIASQGFDDSDPGRTGIYSRRVSDGGGIVRLTDPGNRIDWPIVPGGFSPDGSKVLFFRPDARNVTSDSAPQDLFVVDSDGRAVTQLTPPGTTSGVVFSYDSASWSPDGTQVAVAAAKGPFWTNTHRSVYLASADGRSFERVGPQGDIWDAVWSPDGQWIALSMATKATGGQHQLFLMHPDGSHVRQLTSPDTGRFALQPVWSPDSTQILFLRGSDDVRLGNLWSIDVDGSQAHQVTHVEAAYRGVAWLP